MRATPLTDLVTVPALFLLRTLSVASHQPVLLPIRLARTRRCLMNGEPVTDLTTAVYEMRSVSLQNRNFDILPRHMGHLGLYWRDDDEEAAVEKQGGPERGTAGHLRVPTRRRTIYDEKSSPRRAPSSHDERMGLSRGARAVGGTRAPHSCPI